MFSTSDVNAEEPKMLHIVFDVGKGTEKTILAHVETTFLVQVVGFLRRITDYTIQTEEARVLSPKH